MATAMANAAKTNRVPTLETGAAQLLLEIADGDVSMDKIVELVQISPSIAARLLATANSAWSNPVAPVTSVGDACFRLGLNVVRTTTIALAIGQSFDTNRCPAFDVDQFWCTSIISSRLAAELAAGFDVDPGTAATAALLRNIGLLWLADAMPEETNAALACAGDEAGQGIGDCLQRHCGIDRLQASRMLHEAWRLPASLSCGATAGEDGLAGLLALSETMAADIYAASAFDACRVAQDHAALRDTYEKQQQELSSVRDLARTLF